jgi:hypothetical protein
VSVGRRDYLDGSNFRSRGDVARMTGRTAVTRVILAMARVKSAELKHQDANEHEAQKGRGAHLAYRNHVRRIINNLKDGLFPDEPATGSPPATCQISGSAMLLG